MEEEVLGNNYEVVDKEEELVEDAEELGGEEVIAYPRPRLGKKDLLAEASRWFILPGSLKALEDLVKKWGRYAQCLIELREELRKRGLLYPELERDIARELRAERAKLYIAGLRALALAGSCSSIRGEELKKLCEYARAGPPKYVWEMITRGVRGAKRPDIILSYMCRYKRECCQ